MSESNSSFTLFVHQLRESPFFATLEDESLSQLINNVKQLDFKVNTSIFVEGEPSQGLYWLQSGALKAVKLSSNGKEQILHFIKPGQTFNEAGAFTTLPNPASVIVLVQSEVWLIPREIIKQQIQQDPIFSQIVIDTLAERLRHSVDLIGDLSLRPVIKRLSSLILEESDGDIFFRPSWYTQYELAARLGTVQDVVQKALRKLETENLIDVSRQQIKIINRSGLESKAG